MTLDRGAIERVRLDPAQPGQQHLLQVGVEHRPVGRGGDAHRAEDALAPERGQHGDALPAATRDHAQGPLAARAPGMGADQVGQRRALIEEHQALRRDRGGVALPRRPGLDDRGLVLLGGAQALLFCA
jgi:hypothetical protein